MQKDFHYYCIGVLARAAGFNNEDSLAIAFASQYANDSTESDPIRIGDILFDPVRSSTSGLKRFDWSIQKRVYIPFHFIPPHPIRAPNDPFATSSHSPFAVNILKEAFNVTHEMRRLCRVGLALHALADSWAYQGFSGRENDENRVENIFRLRGTRWQPIQLENLLLDIVPQIGHVEAGYLPDQPFLVWKYKRKLSNNVIERNNESEFFQSAKVIYYLLQDAEKLRFVPPIPWANIKDDIRILLEYPEQSLNKRCQKWRDCFKSIFHPLEFRYDRRAWRNDALEPEDETATDWDDFNPSDFKRLRFPMKRGFYNSPWLHFHRAALRQRHLVLENLL
ncbi:DUF6765 family protein [Acidobacteriota bacterium]